MTSRDDTNSGEPSWLRLELLTVNADDDAARLMNIGALGVEVRDGSTYMEDAFAPVPDGKARLIAYFDADRSPATVRTMVEETIRDAEIVVLADYNDRSWETAWMDYFQATDLSPRVAIGPPWDRPSKHNAELVIIIEPGMAFGTGTHETTRLCARILDDILEYPDVHSMLDVGCGSAILSMIAAGLGVERVVAVDIDETAVRVARENIEKNGFSQTQIDISTRGLDEIPENFDVVVANILSPILLELRVGLFNAVAPGGDLLLSGIAAEELPSFRHKFHSAAFTEIAAVQEGEWTALHLRSTGDN